MTLIDSSSHDRVPDTQVGGGPHEGRTNASSTEGGAGHDVGIKVTGASRECSVWGLRSCWVGGPDLAGRRLPGSRAPYRRTRRPWSRLAILDRRFASGEIDAEEYARARRTPEALDTHGLDAVVAVGLPQRREGGANVTEPLRVLVVDDESLTQVVGATWSEGFTVAVAHTGPDAADEARASSPVPDRARRHAARLRRDRGPPSDPAVPSCASPDSAYAMA